METLSHFAPLVALSFVPLMAVRHPTADLIVLDGRDGTDRVTDADLVRRAQGGEAWAHEAIYRRHVKLVAATARRLLRNPSDVEDIVHETFLIAFEQLHRLLDPAALRGWLTRIAVSRVHRRFRWRKVTSLFSGDEPGARLEDQASGDASPDQRAELALIDRALARMPLKLRTPWVLRFVVGQPLDEVAVACECSLATVKRRLAEAEAQVRAHLGEDGP